jgi:hypothetical protein
MTCPTGTQLKREWYQKYVNSGDDWQKAFFDPAYPNHVRTCPVCSAYEKAEREKRWAVGNETLVTDAVGNMAIELDDRDAELHESRERARDISDLRGGL